MNDGADAYLEFHKIHYPNAKWAGSKKQIIANMGPPINWPCGTCDKIMDIGYWWHDGHWHHKECWGHK